MFSKTILSCLLLISTSQAADQFRGGRPAIVDKQPNKKLFEVEVPELYSTMMYAPSEKPAFKGAIILYGGLGAKSAAYGIAASMGDISSKALKLGFRPFAFQNPLYFNEQDPYAARLATVGKFRALDSQLEWMMDSVRYVIDRASPQRLVIGARSTGASLLLEAYHRYLVTGAFVDVFSRVDDLLIMGMVDPRTFDEWHPREEAWLNGQEQIFDRFAFEAETNIFPSMTYLNGTQKVRATQKLPNITYIVGTNDELTAPELQLDVAKTFQRHHPEVSLHTIVTDTRHNPAASVSYEKNGTRVAVSRMERLSPILTDVFSGKKGSSGLTLTINPEARSCAHWIAEATE